MLEERLRKCEKVNKELQMAKPHLERSLKEIEQLKTDFAKAVQDKRVLKERLRKCQKVIKELQMVTF